MENTTADQLEKLNLIYKEMDEIYHAYAKERHISDTNLWLLYFLYENDSTPHTQKEMCSLWHYPPQTINSALKNLEKQGIITFKPVPGNKKNKLVILTEKGYELTQKNIACLADAEQAAFLNMKEEEQHALLTLSEKYVELLRKEVSRITRQPSKNKETQT